MRGKTLSAAVCAAILAVCGVSCAGAQQAYELSPLDDGGAGFIVAPNGSPHYLDTQLMANETIEDVSYRIVATSNGASRLLAEGSFPRLQTDGSRLLTGERDTIEGRARFQICAAFTNKKTGKHHLNVTFFEESAYTAAGGSGVSFASEYAPPVRLVTDGSLTCEEAMSEAFLAAIPPDRRFPLPEQGPEDVQEDAERDVGSIVYISTVIDSQDRLGYYIEVGSLPDVADVKFRITAREPSGPPIGAVGSQVAFLTDYNMLYPMTMMGIEKVLGVLPPAAVFEVCAAYYDVAERRYWREQWHEPVDLAERRTAPDGRGGRYLSPSDIDWTASNRPLDCPMPARTAQAEIQAPAEEANATLVKEQGPTGKAFSGPCQEGLLWAFEPDENQKWAARVRACDGGEVRLALSCTDKRGTLDVYADLDPGALGGGAPVTLAVSVDGRRFTLPGMVFASPEAGPMALIDAIAADHDLVQSLMKGSTAALQLNEERMKLPLRGSGAALEALLDMCG